GYSRLMEAIKTWQNLEGNVSSTFDVDEWVQTSYSAMEDDINKSILISDLFEAERDINEVKAGNEKLTLEDIVKLKSVMNQFVFDVLGLKKEENSENHISKLDGVMQMLIQMRNQARADKNWALSDQIRDELLKLGIQLKDGKEGTDYRLE